MNRAILIAGLILSIAVLVTGTIVPNVEAKGKPNPDEPRTTVKLSCNDRKDLLNCKASSRQGIGPFDLWRPDGTNAKHYSGICDRSQPFGDVNRIMDGDYVANVKECGDVQKWYSYKINVVDTRITSIVPIPYE